MATLEERCRECIIIYTEDDVLYMIPKAKLAKYEYKQSDKASIVSSLVGTGRLKNLRAARQIEASPSTENVNAFGGAFPDLP